MSGTIESEELDIMLKGLFAMAGMEFDQQVPILTFETHQGILSFLHQK